MWYLQIHNAANVKVLNFFFSLVTSPLMNKDTISFIIHFYGPSSNYKL